MSVAVPVAAAPIEVRGQLELRWTEGATEVHVLRGDCSIRSGEQGLTAQQAVVWRTPLAPGVIQVQVYLKGDVRPLQGIAAEPQPADYRELTTTHCPVIAVRSNPLATAPNDPLYAEGAARRNTAVARIGQPGTATAPIRPVQFTSPQPGQGPLLAPGAEPIAPGLPTDGDVPFIAPVPLQPAITRHVSIYPRALGSGYTMSTVPSENTDPPEYITTITGGVRLVVDGVPVDVNGTMVLSQIDLAADRVIIWTDAERVNEFNTNIELGGDVPFQVYLEGDIVVRQGATVLQAERAYYDLSGEMGLLSNAEVRGFLPMLNSVVRLRAEQIRQVAADKFHARHGWITTSDMGIPGYRIEASDIFVERRHMPGYSQLNPQTGQLEGGLLWFTSSHNKLYLENVPVGYFPYVSSPAEDPGIPLRSINFGYSTVFGAQVKTEWDAETLFGLSLPDDLRWRLSADYLSKRGPMVGTKLQHNGTLNLFGRPAQSNGELSFDYIHDTGTDLLGADRVSLPLESPHRGRVLGRHRLQFSPFTWLNSEIGFLSDRNYLEQYEELEWDAGKDYESLLQLNHQVDNFTASLLGRTHLFDFENTTDWLPRADVTLLSEPVGNTPLLWSTHSSVGYAQLHAAEAPPNPLQDAFSPLPYYADRQGLVAMSRHELALPLSVGPVNLVPHALGEAAYWQQDLAGNDMGRLYGSAGVRGSLMFSKYMPEVYSNILGLNGLAHKMILDADYSFSESSESLAGVAQYNEFDENAQERFRSRFLSQTFGGVLPGIYDPRNYALRSGTGRSVTSPWHELVDDQQVVRLGWRHRLQTRVGDPQSPRIYDWMTLDLEASLFPNADRDNFGETLGLLSANYAWNVGPQTSLLANTVFDVFDGGQRVWNVGMLSNRTARGSLYLGVRGLDIGPIDSTLLIASASYQPSDKWIWTAGTAYDIEAGLDRGQSFTVTRVGEYLLFVVGAGYDRSRNAWSFNFSISPKFGNVRANSTQLSSLIGPSP